MLTQVKIANLQGEYHRFRGNEPILLDDPQTVWVVESGSLALFAIPVKNGIPEGTRRYLFTTEATQAMFAIALSSNDLQRQLLAVATEETELLKVSLQDFRQVMATANGEALALIESWIEQLGLALADIPPPALPFQEEGVRYFSLTSGQIFQPQQGSVSWVQIQKGYARWMAEDELLLTPESGVLPLSADMWLQAESTLDLTVATSAEIEPATLLDSLSQLQTRFLHCIDLLEQQQLNTEVIRFQEREHLNHQVMEETLGELALLLQPEKTAFVTPATDPDQALLVVAGAVGRALGVTIRPPAKSEDLKRVGSPVARA